jgi:5-methylthioadenosine/S-adenosylhomocysteine deaminase
MKLASLIHNLTYRDYGRWISSREALGMATIHAAKACGLEKEIGSIEVGKLADLASLKKDSYPWIPLNDGINQLVYSENGRSVTTVIIAGEIVLEDDRPIKIDEKKIYSEATALRERLDDHLGYELNRTSTLEPLLKKIYFDSTQKEVK